MCQLCSGEVSCVVCHHTQQKRQPLLTPHEQLLSFLCLLYTPTDCAPITLVGGLLHPPAALSAPILMRERPSCLD